MNSSSKPQAHRPLDSDGEHARAEDRRAAHLVERAQKGDQSAFTSLYSTYFDRVYSYLRFALSDPGEAEDAAQQVFINVLEALPRYKRRGQPFRAWLFVIARNQAIQQLRKHGRTSVEEPAELERRRPAAGEDELRALRLTSDEELILLINRLPEPQRQAVLLRYVLDFTGPEIAEILGRSPESVRQLLSRGLGFLRQRLAALGREPSDRRRHPMRRIETRHGRLRPGHGLTLLR
jgi:RNA polymerase sigma-70 factor (ECF subfamily)